MARGVKNRCCGALKEQARIQNVRHANNVHRTRKKMQIGGLRPHRVGMRRGIVMSVGKACKTKELVLLLVIFFLALVLMMILRLMLLSMVVLISIVVKLVSIVVP